MKNLNKIKLILVALTTLVLSKTAFAEGANGSGGAHGVGSHLLDQYENLGSEVLNPLTVPGVQETLNQVKDQLPGFYPRVQSALRKKWYLEPKPIIDCPGGESIILVDKTTAACQTKHTVRIHKNWFYTVPNFSELKDLIEVGTIQIDSVTALRQKQLGIVIHELLRNLRLGQPITVDSEEGLRILVRTFVSGEFDENSLQSVVNETDFGYFNTSTYVRLQMQKVNQFIEEFTKIHDKAIELKKQVAEARKNIKAASITLEAVNSKYLTEHAVLAGEFNDKKIRRSEFLKKNELIKNSWTAELAQKNPIFESEKAAEINKVKEIHIELANLIKIFTQSSIYSDLSDNIAFDDVTFSLCNRIKYLDSPKEVNYSSLMNYEIMLHDIKPLNEYIDRLRGSEERFFTTKPKQQ